MSNVKKFKCIRLRDEDGVTLVLMALLAVVFVAFTAMAVDIAHLYVVRNELHNAADAGALAGARQLYNSDGTAINVSANDYAFNAAIANKSERTSVEVLDPYSNSGDVQRGHWSFATRTFTPNASTNVMDLWNVTSAELDANTNFINAVKVTTRRQSTQAESFFARILGWTGFNASAAAVAYIGFAGKLEPLEVSQPIAICKQAILDAGNRFNCSTGRMMPATIDSAAWTNLIQPCETANPPTLRPLVCTGSGANMYELTLGESIGTTNGQDNSVYKPLRDCWLNDLSLDTNTDGIPDQPWPLMLPVIDCPGGSIGPCATLVGAVELNVLWITEWGGAGPVPRIMADWTCDSSSSDSECWASFVSHFNIQNFDGSPVTFAHKSMYIMPDCSPHVPVGVTGGQNYGILARIPVLVN